MSVITLVTDFGTRDWFVGAMKGAMLRIAPRVTIVDINHEVPAGNIAAGAFALAASYSYFPKGTVHVIVVDPGVGSSRKALAIETTNYIFVGPDNGVLSLALRREKITAIHSLENRNYHAEQVSRTFHGRDVFAPVAAYLAQGTAIAKLGRRLNKLVMLKWPEMRKERAVVKGEIVYFDHFGNAITNINEAAFTTATEKSWEVYISHGRRCKLEQFYQIVRTGQPLGIIGSTGFLEIAVNGGSAKRVLNLKIGTVVTVRPSRKAGSLKR